MISRTSKKHLSKLLIIFLICIFLTPSCLVSRDENPRTLFRIGVSGTDYFINMGFIDSSGRVVIEPKYRRADNFSEGFSFVRNGEVVGYMNRVGE